MIVDLIDDELLPGPTEIYSRLRRRRMKPEHAWHPRHSEKEER